MLRLHLYLMTTLLFISIIFLNVVSIKKTYAANTQFQDVMNQSMAFAKQQQPNAYQAMQAFKPASTFNQYIDHPDQTKYYGGVDQPTTAQLNQDALNEMQKDHGKDILNSINQHPLYVINSNDPDIQHAQLIASEADNIIRGVTDQYIDCKPKQECHMQYDNKMCVASTINQHPTCRKNLVINAKQSENSVQVITAHIQSTPKRNSRNITVNVDLLTGGVVSSTGVSTQFSESPPLQGVPCDGLQIQLVSTNNNDTYPANIQIIDAPSCANHFQLSVSIQRNRYVNRAVDINVTYQFSAKLPPIILESWTNDCLYYEQLKTQGICTVQQADQCVSGSATHIINNIPVTRSCWATQTTYDCHVPASENNCDALQAQGCEQTGSACQTKVGDVCVAFQQSYRCAIKSCVNTADVVCGDGKDYCLDGDCTDRSYQHNQDFAKSVAALSATSEATKSFDQHYIFKGHPQECRDDAGNFSNCCNKSGWGQDWHLAHCNSEEQSLGTNRENNLAIYVGRYCKNKILKKCVEYHQTYCVFDSKIAKIIQEQGRAGQLHVSFGDGKHANCDGITPDQLQGIDLSKIDFSDMYADINNKIKTPDLNQIKELIEQHIQQYTQAGQPND